MTTTARNAQMGDAPALAPLLAELGYPCDEVEASRRLAALLKTPGCVAIVAEADGRIVGLATAHEMTLLHASGKVVQLTMLVVASSARRSGAGRALVEAAEAWARWRGCVRMVVASNERRKDAHAFYEHVGFVHTSRYYSKMLEPATR